MSSALWLTVVLAALVILFAWLGRLAHRRQLSQVAVVTLPEVAAQSLRNSRDIYVYLPAGVETHPNLRYPVLYVNDGQDRDQLALRDTLARLMSRRLIRPIIVVAVPTNENRLREYGTAVAPNAQGFGDLAANYEAFIVDDLMPLINARFPTCDRAVVCGMSLGGLAAFDLAWNHPERFRAVGVFSGSFWWRAGEQETAITPGRRIAHEMVHRESSRPDLRFWFQAGTRDEVSDRDNNGVIDAIQDTTELIDELAAVGYECGPDLMYVEVTGGRHDQMTWARVLPEFLVWAFGAQTPVPDCPE